ncbi:hypothetical protein Tco_0911453 [Tanacetum coccineum]|uniref:Uncharacterized protein n=1 Tax=Tanacetum coccineum TaxID=301880 RepID=A0ABQ5CWU3_9ASTR
MTWFQEDTEIQEDADIQIRTSDDTEVLLEEEEPIELVEDQGSGEKGEKEVTTADIALNTANLPISTASETPMVSTAAERIMYSRRSEEKRKAKGKAIMQESEPPKKIKKKEMMQITQWVAEEERIPQEAKQTDESEKVIDWSDPSVMRYHALQNRLRSVAEVRKNMCTYLKNQGGYKMKDFKGMSYDDIRPIFERVWDQIYSFVPMDSDSKKAEGRRKKSLARKRGRETLSEESSKKHKLEDDAEKEELQVYLSIVSEDEGFDVESLATKYLIVVWETQILANNKYYYQIKRADGSIKHYNLFSAMLYDFDRQDVLELYRLVKGRFQTESPEGYDLLLWGDLKTMMEPNGEDEIWRNQQDWNLIN